MAKLREKHAREELIKKRVKINTLLLILFDMDDDTYHISLLLFSLSLWILLLRRRKREEEKKKRKRSVEERSKKKRTERPRDMEERVPWREYIILLRIWKKLQLQVMIFLSIDRTTTHLIDQCDPSKSIWYLSS